MKVSDRRFEFASPVVAVVHGENGIRRTEKHHARGSGN
jgi:hypothetical protein